MERKKWGARERSYTPGGTRQSNFCTTTFSRFRERNLREGRGGGEEGWRNGGEFTCARVFKRVSVARVCEKRKEKEKRKTDELPLANRSLLPFFPFLTGNYSISSVQLIDALYETWRARVQLDQEGNERDREGGEALSISLSLMIIKAWRDEISLMEDNIPRPRCRITIRFSV